MSVLWDVIYSLCSPQVRHYFKCSVRCGEICSKTELVPYNIGDNFSQRLLQRFVFISLQSKVKLRFWQLWPIVLFVFSMCHFKREGRAVSDASQLLWLLRSDVRGEDTENTSDDITVVSDSEVNTRRD